VVSDRVAPRVVSDRVAPTGGLDRPTVGLRRGNDPNRHVVAHIERDDGEPIPGDPIRAEGA